MLKKPLLHTVAWFIAGAGIGCTPAPLQHSDASVEAGAQIDAAARADAGAVHAAPRETRLELGTGAAAFEPFADGDTLDLVRGCQGSQHVWTSVRAWGLQLARAIVSLELTRAGDGARVGQLQLRIDLVPLGDGGELVGLTLVVPDPDAALGEDLLMRAHLRDAADGQVELARPVRVAWSPDGCEHG